MLEPEELGERWWTEHIWEDESAEPELFQIAVWCGRDGAGAEEEETFVVGCYASVGEVKNGDAEAE